MQQVIITKTHFLASISDAETHLCSLSTSLNPLMNTCVYCVRCSGFPYIDYIAKTQWQLAVYVFHFFFNIVQHSFSCFFFTSENNPMTIFGSAEFFLAIGSGSGSVN